MTTSTIRRVVVSSVLLAVVAAGVLATPTFAQPEAGTAATLTGATITVTADGTNARTVEATYQFRVTEGTLERVNGTMWLFPGHEVRNLSATVNGQQVQPQVTEGARYMRVVVPVDGATDQATVRLQYAVAGPPDEIKAPVWVPEYQTSGSERVVRMTVSLPEGTTAKGAVFPTVESRVDGGQTLRFTLLHVPGFVLVNYGAGAAGPLDIETLSTVGGVLIIVAFFGLWGAYRRGLFGSGGDRDVA